MTLAAGTRVGPYEIVDLLGAGGMGQVYRARDPKLQRDVAIKILPDLDPLDGDRLPRFAREAQFLASLNHPHIAAIYSFEEPHAIVMELVDGPTLGDLIARRSLNVAEATRIAQHVALALEAAHEKGIVHRDLKPANIKVTPNGTVKVLDFGLAKALNKESAVSVLADSPTFSAVGGTRAGVILGTVAYMSPEQARGQALDARTDIWAFGCVLFEMLTGRPAFDGQAVTDVLAAILTREPEWETLPADTPDAVRRLLRRCLQKDLKHRLRHIGDAQFELHDARTVEPPGQAPPRGRHPAWKILPIVGALGALLGAAVYHLAAGARLDAGPQWPTAQVTATRLTNYGQSETDAAISPDGRSFVFLSNHGGTPDLWLRQVAGGDPIPLTNDASIEDGPTYAPDGETIYFARLDSGRPSIWRTGMLGGQAQKVIEGRLPALSRDGRHLAFLRDGPEGSTLMIADATGGGARAVWTGLLGGALAHAPAWSPDGQRVSFTQFGLFAPSNLVVVDATSGQLRQVTRYTKGNEGVGSHTWLPDNRHLLVSFVPFQRQLARSDLGILDVEDGSIERLTMAIESGYTAPSLSADGTRLIATATDSRRDVWKVPLGPNPSENERAAVRLLDDTWDAMWTFVSRDGRTLLFNSPLSGSRNLWMMPLDGSGRPRQITSFPNDALAHSSLSPDGRRVAFASTAAGSSDIWVQDVDGSNLRQLTNDDASDAWPVWSPDGQSLVFNSLRDGRHQIWRVSVADATAERIIDGFFRGDWANQPDGSGTWIVTSTGAGGFRLIDVEQRSVVWEVRRPDALAMPIFSPDHRSISVPLTRGGGQTDIAVVDAASGSVRIAAQLPYPVMFRASWIDGGKAVLVNRDNSASYIVMFDRFRRVSGRGGSYVDREGWLASHPKLARR